MRYPSLIDKRMCNTPIHGIIEREGYGNFGEPLAGIVFNTLCNYQDKAKTVYTSEKKLVEVTGTAYIPGDICPDVPVISGGTAVIFDVERRVAVGRKARNPDGTVNYSVLEVV